MRPPDELKKELVLQWVAKASRDFELAQHLLKEEAPYSEAICFHAQQAAEKYLKAFLTWHQIEFPKTHNVGKLLRLIATIEPELAESLRGAHALTAYGVDLRYPDDLLQVTPKHAESAVELAASVREAIGRLLDPFIRD